MTQLERETTLTAVCQPAERVSHRVLPPSQAKPHKPVRHAVIMGHHVGTIRTLSKLFICQREQSWFHYQGFVTAAHFQCAGAAQSGD